MIGGAGARTACGREFVRVAVERKSGGSTEFAIRRRRFAAWFTPEGCGARQQYRWNGRAEKDSSRSGRTVRIVRFADRARCSPKAPRRQSNGVEEALTALGHCPTQ